jgi:hypothetical protein
LSCATNGDGTAQNSAARTIGARSKAGMTRA